MTDLKKTARLVKRMRAHAAALSPRPVAAGTKAKVTERKGVSGFLCTGCKTWHTFGGYVAAQTAMGHALQHACKCGARHDVTDGYTVTRLNSSLQATGGV